MKRKHTTFKEFKAEMLKDPLVLEQYNLLQDTFDQIRKDIDKKLQSSS